MSAILACLINLSVSAAVCFLKKNNGLQDIFWGLGFLVVSVMTYPSPFQWNYYLIIFNVLVWIWGLRLAVYLFIRNWSKPEDFRYAQWRVEWKAQLGSLWWARALLQVFVLQGFLMWVISIPIWWTHAHLGAEVLDLPFVIGAGFSCFGILYEAIADFQKYQFKKQNTPSGSFIQSGLWKFSRHPNYFGEICAWWGIGIMGAALSQHLLPLFGPVVISYLLIKVSGVPMLEKKQAQNPEYLEYSKHTPALIPCPFKAKE